MLLKKSIPWQLKILAKIILSRAPIPYSFWKKLGLFEHGAMNKEEWAYDLFVNHARTTGVIEDNGSQIKFKGNSSDFSVLELGPGDSLFSAITASLLGASKIYLIDTGDYASKDFSIYKSFLNFLNEKGFNVARYNTCTSIQEILEASNAVYLTEGVLSCKDIPSDSIDYCFSNAVLEHVCKYDFPVLSKEINRILKNGALSFHRVDLKDHLGGQLNNLRFSEKVWEGKLFKNSGFYTNRIRFDEMKSIFQNSGLKINIPKVVKWSVLPTPRNKLDKEFSALSEENMLISGFDLILSKDT